MNKTNPTPTQPGTMEPCPLSHYIHTGLRAYKTGPDPRIVCFDCGLTLRAPDWIKVYERWQSRARAAVAGPRGDVQQVRDQVVDEWHRACNVNSNIEPRDKFDFERLAKLLFAVMEILPRASPSSPAPAEKAQPPDPYAVVIYREEAAKMAFDAIQSALQDDWAEHYSVLQIAGMIATNIRRISPAAPAESTRVEGEQLATDAIEDVLEFPRTSDAGTYAAARVQLAALKLGVPRVAASADNDAESLLSKIVTIADIGSAEEFGDALERLKSIRQLIDTPPRKTADVAGEGG